MLLINILQDTSSKTLCSAYYRFTLFRNKGGKVLTDKLIVGLVTTGRTPLVKGFRNREGRSFDAALVLNPDFTVGYSFPDRKPQGEKSGRKR